MKKSFTELYFLLFYLLFKTVMDFFLNYCNNFVLNSTTECDIADYLR